LAHVAKFSREVVAEVLAAVDIVQVVRPVVELKPAGAGRLKGLCPFHNEKTPSFHVSPDRQAFHCFGCNKGGDAIAFLMEHDGLTFLEALEKLADQGGVRLPAVSESDNRDDWMRKQLLELGKMAVTHFRQMLLDPLKGSLGRQYIDSRKLSEPTVLRFGLGYAPESWNLFCDAAAAKGFKREVLEQSGLARSGERGGFYDFFRNRVVFPIKDVTGNVVAFGGRDLGDNPAKYINSPESIVYRKSRTLYGLHEAREAMRKTKQAILVEGYFDLLRLVDAGIHQVVASCGTALTTDQAALIRRYARDVVIVYDGDAAGIQAALKATGTLSAAGLQVRALCLPDNQDPDDFVLQEGAEAFLKLVEEAPDFVRYYIGNSRARLDSIEGRTDVARELFEILAGLDDDLRIDEYLKRTAKELGLSEQACRSEFSRFRSGRDRGHTPPATAAKAEGPAIHRDDVLFLALVFQDEALQAQARAAGEAGQLAGPQAVCRILRAFLEGADIAGAFTGDDEAQRLHAAAANVVLEEELKDPDQAETLRLLAERRLRRLAKDTLQAEASRIQDAIRAAGNSDPLRIVELIAEKSRLVKKMEELGAA